MSVLRSLLFYLVFFGSGTLFLTLALPALLMPRRVTISGFRFRSPAFVRVRCGIRPMPFHSPQHR